MWMDVEKRRRNEAIEAIFKNEKDQCRIKSNEKYRTEKEWNTIIETYLLLVPLLLYFDDCCQIRNQLRFFSFVSFLSFRCDSFGSIPSLLSQINHRNSTSEYCCCLRGAPCVAMSRFLLYAPSSSSFFSSDQVRVHQQAGCGLLGVVDGFLRFRYSCRIFEFSCRLCIGQHTQGILSNLK